jgi:hypothetical protein
LIILSRGLHGCVFWGRRVSSGSEVDLQSEHPVHAPMPATTISVSTANAEDGVDTKWFLPKERYVPGLLHQEQRGISKTFKDTNLYHARIISERWCLFYERSCR